jgi:hypothetical protein
MFWEIYRNLCVICTKNHDKTPPFDWAGAHCITVLQHYPSGVSRFVLLTELESRWRTTLRRGENAGNLKRSLKSRQLALTDVLSGKLKGVDADLLRCRLCSETDNVSLEFILHHQILDWVKFCRFHQFEPLADRAIYLTQGRVMWGSTPLLLPTSVFCLLIDVENSHKDAIFYDRLILRSYKPFYAHACSRNLAGLTLNDKALFVLGTVCEIGPISSSSHGSASYRVVRLKLFAVDIDDQSQLGSDSGAAAGTAADMKPTFTGGYIFVILYEENIFLADLWKPRD